MARTVRNTAYRTNRDRNGLPTKASSQRKAKRPTTHDLRKQVAA